MRTPATPTRARLKHVQEYGFQVVVEQRNHVRITLPVDEFLRERSSNATVRLQHLLGLLGRVPVRSWEDRMADDDGFDAFAAVRYADLLRVAYLLTGSRADAEDLVQGDASANNMRTRPDGEIALVGWEDISAAPDVCDLAWLLVSSVEPAHWDDVIVAYGRPRSLSAAVPAIMVQGLLSLADWPEGTPRWDARLQAGLLRHE